eukprot:Awhi_evm1s11665
MIHLKIIKFNNYDVEGTFDYDKFFNDLVDIYEKVVGRRGIVSTGFKRRTVKNKKLLRDMGIDIKTSLSEYEKKRWGQFCASTSDTTDAKEFWSLIKKVQSCKKIQTSTTERKLPDGSTTSDPREVMKIDAHHYESSS